VNAVEELPDAGAFLDATAGFRAHDPIQANLVGSVAEGVLGGRTYDSYRWLAIRDDAGHVVGAAVRTAPYNLVVTPMPEAAAEALGRHIARVDPHPPGVTGPKDVVDRVVAHLPGAGTARTAMTDLLRVLVDYRPPAPWAPGRPRVVTAADLDLLCVWLAQFAEDAHLPARDAAPIAASAVERGSMLLWVDDEQPVAMAGHAPLVVTPTGTVARIGPVYTPEPLRGRGYGSAVTAAMVESLQPRSTSIMLFADADNPGSNRVYERLGFEVRATHVEVVVPGSRGSRR
jgi:predicted GNAT family acetyltransferase